MFTTILETKVLLALLLNNLPETEILQSKLRVYKWHHEFYVNSIEIPNQISYNSIQCSVHIHNKNILLDSHRSQSCSLFIYLYPAQVNWSCKKTSSSENREQALKQKRTDFISKPETPSHLQRSSTSCLVISYSCSTDQHECNANFYQGNLKRLPLLGGCCKGLCSHFTFYTTPEINRNIHSHCC